MAELNLDALRAEAGLEEHKVTVGGQTFALPAILPLGVMSAESADDALHLLFGDDADLEHLKRNLSMVRSDRPADEFDADNPQTDIDFICEQLYGIRRPTKDGGEQSPNREARRAAEKAKKK